MKRIIFINAHCNHLLMSTMMYFIFRQKAPAKYASLFDGLINCNEIEVINYVSKKGSVLPRSMNFLFSRCWALLDAKLTLRWNRIERRKVKIITNIDKVDVDDVVIGFIHAKGAADDFNKFPCKKIVFLNQYQCHQYQDLNHILKYATDFILEADVIKQGNYIIKCDLPKYFNFHILPYIVSERFREEKTFKNRKNLAIATGTIAKVANEYGDYFNFYGTSYFHKMRKILYEHKIELEGIVDVFMSPYMENEKKYIINQTDNGIVRLYKILYNLSIAKMGKQVKYFSFNIVEKYNDYKMAVVPEEIVGVPAIGAFESMACGCAFIGLNHTMYTDLGMIPGKHYITYNGTLEDLKEKIAYYQIYSEELEKIAKKGREFVMEHNMKKKVLELFLKIL